MRRDMLETVLGAVVLAVAAFFLIFAYSSTDIGSVEGYEVVADFSNLGGLQVGSDVRVSGVKVGSVTALTLDSQTYQAKVRFSVAPDVQLPSDTAAIIASESLLGGKFLALEPGGDERMIEPGGQVLYTQSTPGFEQLLGQVIYSLQNVGKDASKDASKDEGASEAPTLIQ